VSAKSFKFLWLAAQAAVPGNRFPWAPFPFADLGNEAAGLVAVPPGCC